MLVSQIPYNIQELLITNSNWCQTVSTEAVHNTNMNSQLALSEKLSSYAYIYFRLLHANGNRQKATLRSDRQHFKMSILFMCASTFRSETTVASLIFEHSLFVVVRSDLWQSSILKQKRTKKKENKNRKGFVISFCLVCCTVRHLVANRLEFSVICWLRCP